MRAPAVATAVPCLLLLAKLPTSRSFPGMHRQSVNSSNASGAAWHQPSKEEEVLIRAELRYIIENPDPWWYDDGSYGPLLLRLAWHSSALYDGAEHPIGGSNGATQRFEPERDYHDNRGLALAREILEPVKASWNISYSDLWILAGYEAVEALGGPHIEMAWGRVDATADQAPEICPPEERFPLWDDSSETIREKFARMGFSDRAIVALIGAHTVGKAHPENMGFPFRNWDNTPVLFDNQYFQFLIEGPTGPGSGWREVVEPDPTRPGEITWFEPDPRGGWLMLPSDIMLRDDPQFRLHADEFLASESSFHESFAMAFKRVTELGFQFPAGSTTRHGSFEWTRFRDGAGDRDARKKGRKSIR